MADAAASPSTFCTPEQRKFVLAAAILASALAFIDGSIVSIATPTIRKSLDASLTDAQWIANGYTLSLSALMLLGGAAGDRFGLKRVFCAGIAMFVAMSLLCALAWSPSSLIGFRVLQGVGAAFMIPGSLALISKAYPKAERGRAIGTWAAASAITTAGGPIIGGFLLSQGSVEIWRFIFAINLPLGGLALWMLMARVPVDAPVARKPLDVRGAGLAIVFLGALAWALTGPEADDGLPDAGHLGLWLSVAAFALWGFIHAERTAVAPIMPLRVFASLSFDAANIATFSLYFGLSAVLFFLPMTLIGGWGVSETTAGIVFVPLTLAIASLSGPVGALADRTGPGPLIAAGSALVATAYATLGAFLWLNNFWLHVLPCIVVMALGMALVVAPLSAAVMGSVDDADTGTASGVNNAVSRVAGLVAVAAMGGLAAWRFGLSSAPGEFGLALDTGVDAAHRAASNAAMSAVAYSAATMSGVAAFAAWFGIRSPAAQDQG
ncbi:EmrB/QacA subfamily drug resistance transporter [Hoeflea marina]|uniref:EmrB/QacA subfamily drug resistance transporter n=1 Tax=Hoeflea marina TaxID=274592 RepID=A0A317PU40_9HYPH|nr:MFS transporter [Hoeflea marina]PWW04184.1 EmrB/QacA subfamily drug resistance transporter [Hoeflea marina]